MMSKSLKGSFPAVILAVTIFGIAPTAHAGLGGGISKGSLTIPDSRLFDWTEAGVTGGIPDTSTWNQIDTSVTDTPSGVWGAACNHFVTNDLNGTNDTGAKVYCYIKYANAHTANGGATVLLPAGRFTMLDNQILMMSNVVLRGAGSSRTIFSSPNGFANWCGTNETGSTIDGDWAFVCFTSPQGSPTNLSADINPGDTVVHFASDPGYIAGQLFTVTENKQDLSLLPNISWARILGVYRVSPTNPGSGLTRNLDRPAKMNTRVAYAAAATPYVNAIHNAGLENIGFTVANQPGCASRSGCGWVPMAFVFAGAYDSWVSGIEAANSGAKHGGTGGSRNITIQSSYFHNLQFTDQGGNNNSSSLFITASESVLVANNRFTAVESTVEFADTEMRSVYAYNYSFGLIYQAKDPFYHGRYDIQNLTEGNTGFNNSARVDMWWSTNKSPVFYRNRYLGDSNAQNLLDVSMKGAGAMYHEVRTGAGPNGPDSEANLLNTWYNVMAIPGCDSSLTSGPICGPFDASPTANEWAEKNRYLHFFIKGVPGASTTYVSESLVYATGSGFIGPLENNGSTNVSTGYNGLTPPSAWSGLIFPPSFFLTSKPAWWCNETPWPTTGADIDAVSMNGTTASVSDAEKTPAQRMQEGLACTVSSSSTRPLSAPGVPTLVPQ